MLKKVVKFKCLDRKNYIHISSQVNKSMTYNHTPTAHEKIHKYHKILLRSEEITKKDVPMLTKTCLNITKKCFALADIITHIPNIILEKEKNQIKLSRKKKSIKIEEDDFCKIFSNPKNKNGNIVESSFQNITTLDKYIDYSFKKFSNQKLLGERKIEKIYEYKDNYGIKTKLIEQSSYEWETYDDVYNNIQKIRSGLKKFGLKKGDKVLFYSDTRKEVLTTMLACIKEGIIVSTYSPNMSLKEINTVLNDLNVNTIITEEAQFDKLVKICQYSKKINQIVYFKDKHRLSKHGSNKPVKINERKLIPTKIVEKIKTILPYDEFLNYSPINKPLENVNIEKNDISFICYTSGTTSQPKGCTLTHSNLISNIVGIKNEICFNHSNPTYVAYLPLSYIFEICGELLCLGKGVRIGYSTTTTLTKKSMKVIPGTNGDLDVLKPTIVPSVPTMLNRFKRAVCEELMKKSELEQKLFTLCYNRKLNRKMKGLSTPILDKTIFKITSSFLGGKVNTIICGGAPLDKDLQRFCQIISNSTFIQGYGATEGCAVALSSPDDITTGNVGGPTITTNFMITNWNEGGYDIKNNEGELLISGPCVINNYYKNYNDESFVKRNGIKWFKTGDIVKIRNDGAIMVIGRKKEFIKNANGEFISLNKIEKTLLNCIYVKQICVIVNPKLDYTSAIVVINKDAIKKLGEKVELKENIINLCKNKLIRSTVVYTFEEEFKEILAKYEIPRKVILVSETFNQENGMLTSSGKLRRKVIEEFYKNIIELSYTPYKDELIEPEHLNENYIEQKKR
ncbi:AMP-dependent synthetase/ligase domain-containing protein [Strongyloides ratti]|uniref:long-chain-fatty-acid--CoA ligase n=1 Tax=Strongyloides ratti TaxID=34506 RepID=A0A090LAZ4_STRRB|nr:AMP-dependent synthetase/ligase domain-containing protein [Strongyloides ratti]CEF65278.1 AMP-dependent synthetase/ligase domain-containing protein [Strongyloides ratti]